MQLWLAEYRVRGEAQARVALHPCTLRLQHLHCRCSCLSFAGGGKLILRLWTGLDRIKLPDSELQLLLSH